jgi:prepilin-type N-terminal cleavage/methylation domain-containing protein
MKSRLQKGFTVLEFLIVIAIMCILISIALASLTSSREKSLDEKKVTDLKTAALGIEQYKQVCGTYPPQIDPNQQCVGNDNLGTNTLSKFIPNIENYHFNDPAFGFYYAPLAFDLNHPDDCDGFHLGVMLKNKVEGTIAVGDSNINSGDPAYHICTANDVNGAVINGVDEKMFDIFK